ncbi:hypothetical protein [Streptomyces sp. LN785]|uniref:hypothetical protein n=1 Tax=Streptomyces sp. LN785 TaxID=3112983 RepID=UPI00371305F6
MAALRRKDIDLADRLVVVRRAQAELQDGRPFDKAPKSAAGVRTVSFPGELVDAITGHLEHYAAAGQHGHVFVGEQCSGLVDRFRRARGGRTFPNDP